jgi:hypothetical protein
MIYHTFDLAPTAFAVIGVLLVANPLASGINLGVGALLKVFPAVLLLASPRHLFWRAAVATTATAVVGWVVIEVFLNGSFGFIDQQLGRGLQIESVAAAPLALLEALGKDIPVVEHFGSLEFQSSVGALLGMLATLTGVALLLLIAHARLKGRLEAVPSGDVALTVVLVLIVMSRVNSPQYGTWIVGLAAAALVARATRMASVSVALALMVLLTGEVFRSYGAFPLGNGLVIGLHLMRIVLLLGSLSAALTLILRRPAADQDESVQRIR